MRIALDAMAGDFGPDPLVQGAIMAVRETRHHVILVGDAAVLETILNREQALHPRLSVVHADSVIGMDEAPKASLRKKNSSLAVGLDLVKAGEADAVVSAGNTGATLANCVTKWRSMPEVSRPSLSTIVPVPHHPVVLLDIGSNVDCRPQHLLDFAVMGSVYCREILGRRSPRIGLLTIGSEEGKGNELAVATYRLLTESKLNFVGNVEGGDVFNGRVDVIVCDGFVGNVTLKFGEGMMSFFANYLKTEANKSLVTKLGALAMKPALKRLKQHMDSSELGAAPLLGVNGYCFVAHGAASSYAIKNAIRLAGEALRLQINEKIMQELAGNKAAGNGKLPDRAPEPEKLEEKS